MNQRTSLAELAGAQPAGEVVPFPGGQYEQQAVVLAAQAKAQTEARYVIAYRKPRNWDQVRQDIINECKRPAFAANKSAYYKKPVGDGIEGLGIRFAEVALRCMKNVLIETATVYEDESKETVRVTMTDLEANTTYYLDVRVTKTVERSKPAEDGGYVSWRTNSRGTKVYTVPASDDDLLNKRGALISKAIRTLALRIVPGDIQDEAEKIILDTRKDKAAKDPSGERKAIADGFAEIGVRAEHLVELLGHPLDQCSPAELVELRGYYGAVRDGETTFPQIVEFVQGKRAEQAAAAADVAKRAAEKAKSTGDKTKTPPTPKHDNPAPPAKTDKATEPEPKAVDPEPKPRPEASAEPQGDAGALTLGDALKAVNAGDDDIAEDIARTLGEDAQRKIAQAIAARDGEGGGSFE
jgi:hypothetical protein